MKRNENTGKRARKFGFDSRIKLDVSCQGGDLERMTAKAQSREPSQVPSHASPFRLMLLQVTATKSFVKAPILKTSCDPPERFLER